MDWSLILSKECMVLIQFFCSVLIRSLTTRKFLIIVLLCCALQNCIVNKSQSHSIFWNLNPEAQITYGILLLEQSIRAGSKDGVLEAMDVLAKNKPMPQFFIDSAAWLFIEKDFTTARHILEKGIELFSDEFGLHLLLTECWVEENKFEQALAVLQNYQKHHPNVTLVQQELGILYLKMEKYKEAHHIFSSLPKKYHNTFIRYCHAQALAAIGHNTEAMQQLKLAVKENPEFLEAWLEIGKLLEKMGNYNESATIYLDLLDKDSGNQTVRLYLIGVTLAVKNPELALKYVVNGPESYGFRLAAVALFLDAKYYNQAEILLSQLKQEVDYSGDINFFLAALAYEYHKNVTETLIFLEKVPLGNKYYKNAILMRIDILCSLNKIDDVLEILHQEQKIDLTEQGWWLIELHLLIREKRYEEALITAEKGLTVYVNDKTILFLKGITLNGLGKKDDALTLIENLIERYPDYPDALNFVGYTLIEEHRELERAIILIEKANKLLPNRAYIVDSLAWALFSKGELTKAWIEINRAIALDDSNDATIWEHYGDIAAAMGKKKAARVGWEKALNLQIQHPEVIQHKLKGL